MNDLIALLAGAATLADAATPTLQGVLLSQGLAGVVILALGYFGLSEIKEGRDRARRLEDDNRRLAEENRRVYQLMADQMMPTLTRATDSMVDVTRVIADVNRREELAAALEEGRRRAIDARGGPPP